MPHRDSSPLRVPGILLLSSILTAPVSAATPPVEDEPPPTLSIYDAKVKEGDSGLTPLTFTVHLSAPSHDPVTVEYTTVDGTATVADDDYVAASGALVIAPSDTLGTIVVSVKGDTKLESNEWLLVRLSSPVGATVANGEATGLIINDERTSFGTVSGALGEYLGGNLPIAWGDADANGYQDIPLYGGQAGWVFFQMTGFLDLLANGNYHGAAWCDYDRDGDDDLVILGYPEVSEGNGGGQPTPVPTLLLKNQGGGTFVNVAPALGMDVAGYGETAVWGDFDGDGWPDLFTPYYSHVYPYRSFLYHNNHDGTFTDRALAAGVDLAGLPSALRPEGAQAADWNDDGYLDLYCAHHLFQNDGHGNFTDVRQAVGLPVRFDEGASFVDYDNDGDLDLYLRAPDGPHLFRNDNGHFTEVTQAAGLGPVPFFWGDSWADVDNDGDLDLLLMLPNSPPLLMLNRGDGTFEYDPAFENLWASADLSAWADVDLDGDLDVVIGGSIKQLYVNWLNQRPEAADAHLSVRVLDAGGYRTAYGATVRLRRLGGGPGSIQTRVVDGGSGYLGQTEYDVHFGGVGSGHYALEVVYPSRAGTRVVVDGQANPKLADLEPSAMQDKKVIVYRDGRVEFTGHRVSAVGSAPGTVRPGNLLGMPAPTPARDRVTLPIEVVSAARATLEVDDLRGRRVRRLDLGVLDPGEHTTTWDLTDERGAPAPTGIYFLRLLEDGAPAGERRVPVLR